MRTSILIVIALALATSSYAQELVECKYDGKTGEKFVQTKEDADQWLVRMKEEKYNGGKDLHSECYPLDNNVQNYHLFVQTEGGSVSVQHDLTHAQCEHLLWILNPYAHMNCTNGCSHMMQPSDFKNGECFK